ncbi:MAG: FtsX-like permease family protein, partial [Duncaniella sp.]|nr:FtsX-like permease family protein [Duncaniella sp.]
LRHPELLKTQEAFLGASIKGLSSDSDTSFLSTCIVEGELPDFGVDSTSTHIVISKMLASSLDVGVGDRIDCFFIGDGTYRIRRLKVKGIFDTHFAEFDNNILFGSIEMLRQLSSMPNEKAPLIEINGLKGEEFIGETTQELNRLVHDKFLSGELPFVAHVVSIYDSGAIYFNWLALLDTNVTVILVLMSLLAALTLVSSLFIIVLRRVRDIGTLKVLGATDSLIRNVFITLTMRILFAGMLIGNVLSLFLLWIQQEFSVMPLDPEAYYLDTVPVSISFPMILLLNGATFVIAYLILQLPSAIVASVSPARTINYN